MNTEAVSPPQGELVLTGKGSSPLVPVCYFKIFFRKKGRGWVIKYREKKIENTRFPTCLQTHRHAQLGR